MTEIVIELRVRYPEGLDKDDVVEAVRSTLWTEFYINSEKDPQKLYGKAEFVVLEVS